MKSVRVFTFHTFFSKSVQIVKKISKIGENCAKATFFCTENRAEKRFLRVVKKQFQSITNFLWVLYTTQRANGFKVLELYLVNWSFSKSISLLLVDQSLPAAVIVQVKEPKGKRRKDFLSRWWTLDTILQERYWNSIDIL